jgi:hypothetical protein
MSHSGTHLFVTWLLLMMFQKKSSKNSDEEACCRMLLLMTNFFKIRKSKLQTFTKYGRSDL